jgi:hypothetical protein
MFSSRRGLPIRDTIGLAGWFFADLLLGMAMLFLVLNTAGSWPKVLPTNTPTPTLTPIPTSPLTATSTPTITPIPTPEPTSTPNTSLTLTIEPTPRTGLDMTPVLIQVEADPALLITGDPETIYTLQVQINAKFKQYQDRRVGLVITLGYHDNVASGVALANQANKVLRSTYPLVFDDAVMKAFWWSKDINHKAGVIDFEVYFLTTLVNS